MMIIVKVSFLEQIIAICLMIKHTDRRIHYENLQLERLHGRDHPLA
jgi:hypothetical protein